MGRFAARCFGLTPPQVCALCDAFATDDPAELRAHTEVCFARASRVTVEETTVAEETAYQHWLAVQALPLVQTSAVLMTLNSLGSAVRVGLVLLGPRFARVKSSLSALPLLYALPSTGLPPLLPSDVLEDALRSMAALVLPAMVLVRLPYHLAFFYVTTTPSWRDWYAPSIGLWCPTLFLIPHSSTGTSPATSDCGPLPSWLRPWSGCTWRPSSGCSCSA